MGQQGWNLKAKTTAIFNQIRKILVIDDSQWVPLEMILTQEEVQKRYITTVCSKLIKILEIIKRVFGFGKIRSVIQLLYLVIKQILLGNNQMNKRQQQQFVAFFQEIYQTEEMLDFIKLSLVQSSNYNPSLLFDLISQRKQNISLQDLRSYLVDKAACNQRQLYQIFQRFDWSRQGSISRIDFSNEMTPFGRQSQSINRTGGTVSAEIQGHFISLFIQILKRFRILEVARKQLKYIQPYDAFQHIDYLKTGSLGIGELRKLFYDNDFNVNDRQLYYLLHGLRRRCYRNINLEVFCQSLDPLQFGQYLAYRNKIQEEKEKQFANRSMHEEESVKRSRLQAQRIEHQFQKNERKKQAQLERQLQLQDRVNAQVSRHEQQQVRQIRRALLQEDRDLRYGLAAGDDLLVLDQQRNAQDRLENEYLNNLRIREEQLNATLSNSALKREQQLERSRRAVQLERDIAYRQEIQKEKSHVRTAAVAKEFQYSRRRIEEQSRRRYEEESLKRIAEESRKRYEDQLYNKRRGDQSYQRLLQNNIRKIEQSRKQQLEESRKIDEIRRKAFEPNTFDRQKLYRDLQLQRQRARQEMTAKRSKLVSEQQKQLQKTRYDARSRKTEDLSASYR